MTFLSLSCCWILDWILYQKILDHLNELIIELGSKLEGTEILQSPVYATRPNLD